MNAVTMTDLIMVVYISNDYMMNTFYILYEISCLLRFVINKKYLKTSVIKNFYNQVKRVELCVILYVQY